jgi:DNA-binding ferritin-like protein
MNLPELAIALRASQLYAHQAHNLTTGCNFQQDHATFAAFYDGYEKAYDDVVERIIGLTGTCDITSITRSACDVVEKSKFRDAKTAYSVLLATEKSILTICDSANKKASLGTQNLIQQIADDAEKRMYIIQRRLKDN